MEDTLISYKTAKLAKQKGFNFYDTGGYYHINEGYSSGYAFCYFDVNEQTECCLLCPDQSLLQKWIREVHNIHINIQHDYDPKVPGEDWNMWYDVYVEAVIEGQYSDIDSFRHYNTYEEALEKGLYEALKLIELEK